MMHKLIDFSGLPGSVKGLSKILLQEHLGLYKGYVQKLNEIRSTLEEKEESNIEMNPNYTYDHWSELKRRETIANNAVLLHENYFGSIIPGGTKPTTQLKELVHRDYDNMHELKRELRSAALSTSGWALLTHDGERLRTWIVHEHHDNIPIGQHLLLALDSWEHAFARDYGTDRNRYITTFFNNCDWEKISSNVSV